MPASPPRLSPSLVKRFDRPGPRYTSYPTADRFRDDFGADDYEAALRRANSEGSGPVAAYIHLPFCESLCGYCACNVVISSNQSVLQSYLERLAKEIERVAQLLPNRRVLKAIHLGGGTPNSYSDDALGWLLDKLEDHFEVPPDAELAIEVDPRHATPDRIRQLRALGFSRLSMGIQSLDPDVQRAVSRRCTFEHIQELVAAARDAGYEGVNLDLIYGLPSQTSERFAKTLDQVLTLRPDRIALYSFAYLPTLRKNQRLIDPTTLPEAGAKLKLFTDAWQVLTGASYIPIGMDHFALPHDALAVAADDGTLRRNFQGYTTSPVDEIIGFGVSAIGDIGGAYVQNAKTLRSWSEAIDAGRLPTRRGLRRSGDDDVRRWIIQELMCRFRVADGELRSRYGQSLGIHYADALDDLQQTDHLRDLVEVGRDEIRVTPLGRVFVRAVAAVFDRYLREQRPTRAIYSKVI